MNLKNVNHLDELRRLRLPMKHCLLVDSSTMALLGLLGNKGNDDIDLWVTDAVFEMMGNDKNLVPVKKDGRLFYESKSGNVEMSNKMPCTKGPVENYLKRAIVFYGIHFVSVDDLIDWKKCMGRPKDYQHLKLLYKYKKSDVTNNYLSILKRM